MTNRKLNDLLDQLLTADLGFESPQPRFRDCLDFKEVSVERARATLLKAYLLGTQQAKGKRR